MRVDGRDISVSGSLLQPVNRRTNDILRLILATAVLAMVITGSLVTRPRWIRLEKSVSEIVGVLSPTQSDVVYLLYGFAILALPFMILIGLIVGRQWKLLGAYGAAAILAALPLSITSNQGWAAESRCRHRTSAGCPRASSSSVAPASKATACRHASSSAGTVADTHQVGIPASRARCATSMATVVFPHPPMPCRIQTCPLSGHCLARIRSMAVMSMPTSSSRPRNRSALTLRCGTTSGFAHAAFAAPGERTGCRSMS